MMRDLRVKVMNLLDDPTLDAAKVKKYWDLTVASHRGRVAFS
jgi:hypothetical protein